MIPNRHLQIYQSHVLQPASVAASSIRPSPSIATPQTRWLASFFSLLSLPLQISLFLLLRALSSIALALLRRRELSTMRGLYVSLASLKSAPYVSEYALIPSRLAPRPSSLVLPPVLVTLSNVPSSSVKLYHALTLLSITAAISNLLSSSIYPLLDDILSTLLLHSSSAHRLLPTDPRSPSVAQRLESSSTPLLSPPPSQPARRLLSAFCDAALATLPCGKAGRRGIENRTKKESGDDGGVVTLQRLKTAVREVQEATSSAIQESFLECRLVTARVFSFGDETPVARLGERHVDDDDDDDDDVLRLTPSSPPAFKLPLLESRLSSLHEVLLAGAPKLMSISSSLRSASHPLSPLSQSLSFAAKSYSEAINALSAASSLSGPSGTHSPSPSELWCTARELKAAADKSFEAALRAIEDERGDVQSRPPPPPGEPAIGADAGATPAPADEVLSSYDGSAVGPSDRQDPSAAAADKATLLYVGSSGRGARRVDSAKTRTRESLEERERLLQTGEVMGELNGRLRMMRDGWNKGVEGSVTQGTVREIVVPIAKGGEDEGEDEGGNEMCNEWEGDDEAKAEPEEATICEKDPPRHKRGNDPEGNNPASLDPSILKQLHQMRLEILGGVGLTNQQVEILE